ncbi:4373_t:CDS:1, partial [Rhizophagus irregularis]
IFGPKICGLAVNIIDKTGFIGFIGYVSGKCIKYALPYIFQLKNWSLDRLDGTRYS